MIILTTVQYQCAMERAWLDGANSSSNYITKEEQLNSFITEIAEESKKLEMMSEDLVGPEVSIACNLRVQ